MPATKDETKTDLQKAFDSYTKKVEKWMAENPEKAKTSRPPVPAMVHEHTDVVEFVQTNGVRGRKTIRRRVYEDGKVKSTLSFQEKDKPKTEVDRIRRLERELAALKQ